MDLSAVGAAKGQQEPEAAGWLAEPCAGHPPGICEANFMGNNAYDTYNGYGTSRDKGKGKSFGKGFDGGKGKAGKAEGKGEQKGQ